MRAIRPETPEKLDPFDHAFVDAVLQLQGIDEQPTYDQFKSALVTLEAYYTALMKAPASTHPGDEDWLDGHTIDSAAFQFAFLFTQFGVLYVTQATPEQSAAFNYWWQTGDLPPTMQPLPHARSGASAGH